MSGIKGKVAVVGIGEVPSGRYPDRPAMASVVESARQAILDAGIDKQEIDTVIPTGVLFSGAFGTDLACSRLGEELGLMWTVKQNMSLFCGGSSSSSMLRVASALIVADVAKCVLCVQGDKLATGVSAQGGIDLFAASGINYEWEVPFGQHYSSVAGLITQRYMYETGTTEEQIASVCVSNRKWAELNPNAMFRKPLTIEEVMSSKMLSTPLRAKESNMLADGGAAFIVMSAERARNVTKTPVYVLGEGSVTTHFTLSQEVELSRLGYAQAAQKAFKDAGLKAKDIDIAELYDSYPIFQIIALEEVGLVKRGEAGAFVMAGNTWPGGKLPMTTNGGMLSQGHTGAGGGVAVMVEAIRQLMGKAGERQVKGAKFAVDTGTGGTYCDHQVTILGNEIP